MQNIYNTYKTVMNILLSFSVKLTGETNRCKSDELFCKKMCFAVISLFLTFFNQSTKCKTQTQFQRFKALA